MMKHKKKLNLAEGGKTQDVLSQSKQKNMFSAATFYDVIDSLGRNLSSASTEPTVPPSRPATVAFYGFRGGAGRTLALAHVAMMFAQRGLRVAVIDFDIEAPGLHIVLGAECPPKGKGIVPLLMKAIVSDPNKEIGVIEHLQVLTPKEGTGKVLLLPSGNITRSYLSQIEELGVGLWHEAEHSPLERIINELHNQDIDAVFVDCRTGFNGIAASVLFHHSDLAVIFLPLSNQIWDGVDILFQATASSRMHRSNKPDLLIVPSMVPPGEVGRAKLQSYISNLKEKYEKVFGVESVDSLIETEDDGSGDEPWLHDGIIWDARLSTDGVIRQPFMPGGPWGIFQALYDSIITKLGLDESQATVNTGQIKGILEQLKIKGTTAFAEELEEEAMQRIMVPSESVRAAVDRTSAIVVGAKGSGKTLLWRYLVQPPNSDNLIRLPPDTNYIVGHSPKMELDPQGASLSADAFKELELVCRMRDAGTYKAFWLLYCLFRLSKEDSQIQAWLIRKMPISVRVQWKKVSSCIRMPDFAPLLNKDRISTIIEDVFASLDEWLVHKPSHYVLAFDGLDNGFQVGKPNVWYTRRERFVAGLLQVVADWRSRLRRIQFKVFLREDIYLSIDLQNRSHLDAAKHELRFGPTDLWQLALKIAASSPLYQEVINYVKIGADGLFKGDEAELKALLFPLWGRTVERGKKAYTANYILKRTSDAQGRLFPRTFIQMLDAAINDEKRQGLRNDADRVIRFKSLQSGVKSASRQRVVDLRTEYVELKPYLEALRGAPAIATPGKFIVVMKTSVGKPSISLHMGPGGWRKVLDRLTAVGVLAKKVQGEKEEERYSVALLYRDGLGLRSAGLK